ncbi:MAG: hypothetical protein V1738_02330 [Patescibacteria group bacterium]
MNTPKQYSIAELGEALRAIASLISKLVKVRKKLRKGTAQHTLAVNRLKALRVAATLIRKETKETRRG